MTLKDFVGKRFNEHVVIKHGTIKSLSHVVKHRRGWSAVCRAPLDENCPNGIPMNSQYTLKTLDQVENENWKIELTMKIVPKAKIVMLWI